MSNRSPSTLRSSKRRAFTLIELVVVMVIIGIWAAIAVPRVAEALVLHRVKNATHRIAKDLSLAKRRAKATSSNVTITFDMTQSSYQVTGATDMANSTQGYIVSLADPPYKTTISGVNFGGATTAITFDGYGKPDLQAQGVIVIMTNTHSGTIWVDPVTGKTTTYVQ